MNIPAPGSGYSDYGYSGGSLRNHFVDDPYGSYGSNEGGYSAGDVAAYRQQLQSYYTQLLSVYRSLQEGDPRRAQARQYIDMSLQYAQQVGMQLQGGGVNEWDPNSAMIAEQGVSFPISYQDGNHIVTDEGPSTNITVKQNDSVTKQIDAYQKTNTLQIPSSAASVSVVQTAEGDDVKWEVTITFPNGTTRKIIYHNVDREGFQLNLQSPDTSQVHVDASVTSGTHAAKLNNSELGSSSQSQQAGDPPTRMDGDKRVYDGTSFDISPVPSGTNKETKVLASGDVSITPNSNEEYYVMEYQAGPPSKYIVKVYANEADKAATPPKIKETITIDGSLVDHISFAGDPSRIEFAGALHATGDVHALNSSAAGAAKISMGTSGGGLGDPLDPNHLTDNIPDSKDEATHTAYYNNPDNVGEGVDLHAYYDDTYNIHDITTPGPVTIRTTSYSDTVEITRTGTDPNFQYEIKVKKNGTSPVETFKVKGPPSSIKIDALPAQIKFGDHVFTSADDSRISVLGAPATSTSSTTPQTVTSLLAWLKTHGAPTLTEAQIKTYATEAGLSESELAFPTTPPNSKWIDFLKKCDPALNTYLSDTNAMKTDPARRAQMRDRLIELLKQIYPGVNITSSITYSSTQPALNMSDDIQIGNFKYDILNNSTGAVRFADWENNASASDA